jgi:hypothetical protein
MPFWYFGSLILTSGLAAAGSCSVRYGCTTFRSCQSISVAL